MSQPIRLIWVDCFVFLFIFLGRLPFFWRSSSIFFRSSSIFFQAPTHVDVELGCDNISVKGKYGGPFKLHERNMINRNRNICQNIIKTVTSVLQCFCDVLSFAHRTKFAYFVNITLTLFRYRQSTCHHQSEEHQ